MKPTTKADANVTRNRTWYWNRPRARYRRRVNRMVKRSIKQEVQKGIREEIKYVKVSLRYTRHLDY